MVIELQAVSPVQGPWGSGLTLTVLLGIHELVQAPCPIFSPVAAFSALSFPDNQLNSLLHFFYLAINFLFHVQSKY